MNALETALYDELTGDTALMELVDGVYAYMTPENAPLPVIVFYSAVRDIGVHTCRARME